MKSEEILRLFDDIEERLEDLQKSSSVGHYLAAGGFSVDENGLSIATSGDLDNYIEFTNSSITTYTSAEGFINLQATDPTSNTYGVLNYGMSHDANNLCSVSAYLNEIDFFILKGGAARYVIEANYDYVYFNAPIRLPSFSSAPATGVQNGMAYYDSTLNKFRKYENGAWANW